MSSQKNYQYHNIRIVDSKSNTVSKKNKIFFNLKFMSKYIVSNLTHLNILIELIFIILKYCRYFLKLKILSKKRQHLLVLVSIDIGAKAPQIFQNPFKKYLGAIILFNC